MTDDGRQKNEKGFIMSQKEGNAKYFTGSLYPENMPTDWEDNISNILQLPACYCIHNKDTNNDKQGRKTHVHLIVAFRNTTTKNHALNIFNRLSLEGLKCCPFVESVIDIQHIYNYLIHDTDDARKKGKFQYDPSERICVNGFDIGLYVQQTASEKEDLLCDIEKLAFEPQFMNFKRLAMYVRDNMSKDHMRVTREYSGYLERITKGNYLDFKLAGLDLEAAERVIDFHESNERDRKR